MPNEQGKSEGVSINHLYSLHLIDESIFRSKHIFPLVNDR